MGENLDRYRRKQGLLTAGTDMVPPGEEDDVLAAPAPAASDESHLDRFRREQELPVPQRRAKPSAPISIPVAEPERGTYDKAVEFTSRSVIEQLIGGYHDYRTRANKAAAVGDVERLTSDQIRNEPHPGQFGFSTKNLQRFQKAQTDEGKEEVLKEQRAEDLKRLKEHLEIARKHEARGATMPLSPQTMEFLNENSDLSIGEAFAEAPGQIVAELGLRSLVASSEGIGLGVVLGAVGGGAAGPAGGAAGFGTGMAIGSARVEYAASLVEVFEENGADWNDPESIMKLVGDDEFMEEAQKYATTRAAVIGGVDGVAGLIGAKHFTPGIKGAIARELANLGIQMPVQTGLGAGGEALGQLATEGEITSGRQIAAEAAGELVTAPVEVAGAAAAGARARRTALPGAESPLTALEDAQNAARDKTAAAGGDALDQEVAAARAGMEVSAAIDDQVEAGRRYQEGVQAGVESTQAREAAFQEAEIAAQQLGTARTRLARGVDIDEGFAAREGEQVAEKGVQEQQAFQERELRTEMEKGVEIEQATARETALEKQPAPPTMADIMPAEVRALAEPAPAPQAAAPTPPGAPQLEDLRPPVVTPKGEVMTARQQDEARRAVDEEIGELMRAQIDQEAQEAATSPTNKLLEPTEAQKRAGNYKKGHVAVQGLDVSIENPKDSVRSFTRDDGSTGEQTMQDHYGYIRRTEGADGDQVDVFLGDQPDSDTVFVVDQINQETGQFDEHKVMMGYPNQLAATRAYRRNFEQGFRVGEITPMAVLEFKAWLKEGSTTSPLQPIRAPRQAPQVATTEEITEIRAAAQRRAPRRKVRRRIDTGPPAPRMQAARVQAAAQKFAKSVPGLGTVQAGTLESIPTEIRQRVEADGQGRAKGAYDVASDTLYVFAENHRDEADVQKTLLHEGVAHKGLRSLFPDEAQFNGVMGDVYENANTEAIGKLADRYGLNLESPTDQLVAAEEYIAQIAEGRADASLIQKVVDAVRNALRKVGAVRAWSDNDIRALLRKTRSKMKGKSLADVIVVSEAEVEETGEIVDIEEPADVAIRRIQKRRNVVEQLRGCMG